jgi:hypothetical protein
MKPTKKTQAQRLERMQMAIVRIKLVEMALINTVGIEGVNFN